MKKFYLLILNIALFCNCSDKTINLGSDYFLRIEGKGTNDILSRSPIDGSIPCDVLMYDFNSDFIIAKQKPNKITSPMYEREFEYKNGRDSNYYWIIGHNPKIFVGPLNEVEYLGAREKYKIPKDLILKNVYE
jgi:hypothetical protein